MGHPLAGRRLVGAASAPPPCASQCPPVGSASWTWGAPPFAGALRLPFLAALFACSHAAL
eukprot:9928750-Alexandrium_andersonii.AAC.1